jgi:hypothetical protein
LWPISVISFVLFSLLYFWTDKFRMPPICRLANVR